MDAPQAIEHEVDLSRADFYALIGNLLLYPPTAELLAALSQADEIVPQDSSVTVGDRWEKLVATAALLDVTLVQAEHDALFTSSTTPPVNPYASFYLSGFLMEKPLAVLRRDLGRLGLTRAAGVSEMEDHLAALCETMRLLITQGQTAQTQGVFFDTHIASWAARCMEDIRIQPQARFYAAVADFVDAFFAIETAAFAIDTNGVAA